MSRDIRYQRVGLNMNKMKAEYYDCTLCFK